MFDKKNQSPKLFRASSDLSRGAVGNSTTPVATTGAFRTIKTDDMPFIITIHQSLQRQKTPNVFTHLRTRVFPTEIYHYNSHSESLLKKIYHKFHKKIEF